MTTFHIECWDDELGAWSTDAFDGGDTSGLNTFETRGQVEEELASIRSNPEYAARDYRYRTTEEATMEFEAREFSVTFTVTAQDLEDFTQTMLSGCRYWARVSVNGDGSWKVVDFEDGGKEYTLTLDKVITGLKLAAMDQPTHFADFISHNVDDETGDIVMQLATLGRVVYG